jgi:glutaredoxin
MKLFGKWFMFLLAILMLASSVSCVHKYQLDSSGLRALDLESDVVIIYTANWCPVCKRAKLFLDEQGIEYIELNYEDVKEQRRLLTMARELNYAGDLNGVPIFIARKRMIVGFNPTWLLKALEKT